MRRETSWGGVHNQIVRFRDDGGVGVDRTAIFTSDVQSGIFHIGGRILFGPDRKLYLFSGDADVAANAQNLDNIAGKILRMTATGMVPADNPIPGSLIYTYGNRNSIGFAFDPLTGRLWEDENGPQCNDELNRIKAGANYGWGEHATCRTPPDPPLNTNQDGPGRVLPLEFFPTPIAPTGMAFCQACGLPGRNEGAFFFGTANTMNIQRVELTADRMGIASVKTVYTAPSGINGIEHGRGPDRAIYFSTRRGIWRLVSA
jgi:glucose/arabinose dehydrogenase